MNYDVEELAQGDDDLPDPDVVQLRASLNTFPWPTGVAIARWRPRSWSQLSDEASGLRSSLFLSVE